MNDRHEGANLTFALLRHRHRNEPPSQWDVENLLHERNVDVLTSEAEESHYAMLDQPAMAA